MIDHAHPLLLGSGSPRRREMLRAAGIPLRFVAAEVDETVAGAEDAAAYLERVVLAKLAAVVRLPEASGAGAVLVADTSVVVDGRPLGKPRDEAEARRMLSELSGRAHDVLTRFVLATPEGRALHAETVATTVRFRPLAGDEIDAYAATGEGLDKAGAYAVQGIGAFAVASIEGSPSNVIGLPMCEVVLALRRTGLVARFPPAPPPAP